MKRVIIQVSSCTLSRFVGKMKAFLNLFEHSPKFEISGFWVTADSNREAVFLNHGSIPAKFVSSRYSSIYIFEADIDGEVLKISPDPNYFNTDNEAWISMY